MLIPLSALGHMQIPFLQKASFGSIGMILQSVVFMHGIEISASQIGRFKSSEEILISDKIPVLLLNLSLYKNNH